MSFSTVRLPTELVEQARREAERTDHSIAAQIGYWVRLGQLVETTPEASEVRVKAALAGKLSMVHLSRPEADLYFEDWGDVIGRVSEEEEKWWAEQRAEGSGSPSVEKR